MTIQARASDAALQARLDGEAYSEGLKLCTMSREQLDQAMPKPDEAEEKGVVSVRVREAPIPRATLPLPNLASPPKTLALT